MCVDSYGKKAGMGVLDGGGFMFSLPLHTVRKLLNPETVLLQTLGRAFFSYKIHIFSVNCFIILFSLLRQMM